MSPAIIVTPAARAALLAAVPRSRRELAAWIAHALGFDVPDHPLIPGHAAPLDYLEHAFFESHHPRDAIVWAARGSGKTFYAAVATALDLLFKPGIEVMILGGSLDQSQRMLAHLRAIFRAGPIARSTGARMTDRRITLASGSSATVLAQSHTSVRGARPQKLRCDEADLFHPDIWNAAQLVPRSRVCGSTLVRGAVEALSTWHRPAGLMATLIGDARDPASVAIPARKLFRWNVIDVLERCPPERPCDPCTLLDECASRAKRADAPRVGGHITIDDAIALKRRSDIQTWRAEMLCDTPLRTGAVYPEFDPDIHIAAFPTPSREEALPIGGIDFGFRDPTIVLWGALAPDDTLRILAELETRETTTDALARIIRDAPWPTPAWFGADPAGHQRSATSGMSPITALRRHGLSLRARRFGLIDGLRAVRARIAPGSGSPTLLIHPRCPVLIRSLRSYRFPDAPAGAAQLPLKDGPDHAADALRYLITNIPVHPTAPPAFSYL